MKVISRKSYSFRWTILLAILAVCLSFSANTSGEAVEVEIGAMSADPSNNIPNTFPDLNGMPGEEAKATLEAKYPSLKVFILPEDSMVTMDYLEDRVRIFVDGNGKVSRVPMIG